MDRRNLRYLPEFLFTDSFPSKCIAQREVNDFLLEEGKNWKQLCGEAICTE